MLAQRNLRDLHTQLVGFIRARLWLQVLIAMALGVGAGIALGSGTGWVAPSTSQAITSWLALPGNLFLALVQMIVIPLVVASVVLGMSAAGKRRSAQAHRRARGGVLPRHDGGGGGDRPGAGADHQAGHLRRQYARGIRGRRRGAGGRGGARARRRRAAGAHRADGADQPAARQRRAEHAAGGGVRDLRRGRPGHLAAPPSRCSICSARYRR